jgi:tetratricopeptide (TPR) repeat protein
MKSTVRFVIAGALLAGMLAAPMAFAAGSGGGGASMSSTPSSREDPQVSYQAGVAAMNAQNYREAIRQFRAARRGLPDNSTINFALGRAYVGNNEDGEAQDAFERAIADSAAPVGAWLELGRLHLRAGRREQAVAIQTTLTQKVSACDAACGDARRAQLNAALTQLTQALDAPATPAADPATTGWNFPSAEEGRTAYAEAVGLINQERYAEAFATLERTQEAVGPHPDVLNYMGFTSRKLGRLDDALAYYGEALTIDPNHLGATEYLGELYIQLGQLDRARTQLARLDELCAYGCAQREELSRWISAADAAE